MTISAAAGTPPALNNLGGFGASAATAGAKATAKAGKAVAARRRRLQPGRCDSSAEPISVATGS